MRLAGVLAEPREAALLNEEESRRARFEALVVAVERRLAVALSARYGNEVGREATADALAWAWEHLDRLDTVANQAGYLFRVGQSCARRARWRSRVFRGTEPETREIESWFEPKLDQALQALSHRQRASVVLAHGYGYTHHEIAELLGISPSTVQNHVERGLAHLRRELEV